MSKTPDLRNIVDKFKHLDNNEILLKLKQNYLPYAVMMENLESDFNIGTVFRNANAFSAQACYFLGNKAWDRRGAVGVQNYIEIMRLKTHDDLEQLKSKYTFVALENTPDAVPIDSFVWPGTTLMIIGSECSGISKETLEMCSHVVQIIQTGSTRSLNAGTASGIAMYDYTAKYRQNV